MLLLVLWRKMGSGERWERRGELGGCLLDETYQQRMMTYHAQHFNAIIERTILTAPHAGFSTDTPFSTVNECSR